MKRVWVLVQGALLGCCLLTASCAGWRSSPVGRDRDVRLYEFHARSCLPCRKVAPIIDLVASDYPHVVVERVDVDADPVLADRHRATFLPLVVVEVDGRTRARIPGIANYWAYARALERAAVE